jgi:D-aspartate ligase
MYESEDALVEFLLELAKDYPGNRVLIPASDDCAHFLGKNRDRLQQAYELCVAEPSVMENLVNKKFQYDCAQRLGVPIPETYFPTSREELAGIAERIGNYPYIIKPLVAHLWRLASMKDVSQGRKAVLVRNAEELREAYEALGDHNEDIMVQEVISGRDEELFTFLGYFSRQSVPVAYCVRRKVRQLPVDFGYCTMTTSCHSQEVVDHSIRLLQGMGFSGICGVEYKYDAASGEYKLIEINPRPVNTIALAPASGVDIPWIAFQDLLGHEVAPVTEWADGVTWVRLYPDLLALKQLRATGRASYRQWLGSLFSGRTIDAALSMDDMRPGMQYYGDILKRRFFPRRALSSP